MVYYNTTNLKGDELKTSQKKAVSQEQKILDIFNKYQIPLSPTDIYSDFFKSINAPITSIRRALSNLTRDGKLEKTSKKKLGMYGKYEHCWQLVGCLD
tara:strand:+ start:1028 stop:1321 length:294 start_codon:yes stop_codon:yes gene_type:complete